MLLSFVKYCQAKSWTGFLCQLTETFRISWFLIQPIFNLSLVNILNTVFYVWLISLKVPFYQFPVAIVFTFEILNFRYVILIVCLKAWLGLAIGDELRVEEKLFKKACSYNCSFHQIFTWNFSFFSADALLLWVKFASLILFGCEKSYCHYIFERKVFLLFFFFKFNGITL